MKMQERLRQEEEGVVIVSECDKLRIKVIYSDGIHVYYLDIWHL